MKGILALVGAGLCCVALSKELPVETIRTPRLTTSTGVIIHKQTENFVDIEAPVERIWIGCSPISSKDKVSFLGIEVEDADTWYSFGPRRAVHDAPMCLAETQKYREMLKGTKTVRVVGQSLSFEENVPTKRYESDLTPRRFTDKPKVMSSFFVRLQAGDKCRAYFSTDCDLPKNYWAGSTPAK